MKLSIEIKAYVRYNFYVEIGKQFLIVYKAYFWWFLASLSRINFPKSRNKIFKIYNEKIKKKSIIPFKQELYWDFIKLEF